MPPGLSLDSSGVLSGAALELKDFSFSVKATNCFGTSSPVTINVFVSQGGDLTPFSVDIEQYKETSTDCCSITPSFSILYFSNIQKKFCLNFFCLELLTGLKKNQKNC